MSWKKSLAKGNKGEDLIKNYFYDRNIEVIDVSEDPSWQSKGVDFIVKNKLIDVKTQRSVDRPPDFLTGYENAEITLEHEKYVFGGKVCHKGWLHTSLAERFIFVGSLRKIAFSVSKEDLLDYIEKYDVNPYKIERYYEQPGNYDVLYFIKIQNLVDAGYKVGIDHV